MPTLPGAVVLDPHEPVTRGGRRRWHLVDGGNVPLLQALHGLAACHRAPFVVSLYLVESGWGDGWGRVLGEAHLSSAAEYRALLGTLGQTAALLLRRALGAAQAGTRPFVPGEAMPVHPMGLARAYLAQGLHWLRARAGGDMYGIAVLDRAGADCLGDQVVRPACWTTIDAADGFVADPFFWPGRPGMVLCEAYSHRTGRGRLVSLQLDTERAMPRDALRTEFHLSYPFAWDDGGRVLCLPEMAAARRQSLYALSADGALEPVCTVADGVAMADPTVMRIGGLYWIAYTDVDIGAYDNLCLMFAERPEGPWVRHPGNPVKIDARSSRPAGTPFWVGERLFRPAQDCARTYGGAVAINAITRCTPSAYAEEVVGVLRPDPTGRFPDGLHTLAVRDGRIAIDGKLISYHPRILCRKLARNLRRRKLLQ